MIRRPSSTPAQTLSRALITAITVAVGTFSSSAWLTRGYQTLFFSLFHHKNLFLSSNGHLNPPDAAGIRHNQGLYYDNSYCRYYASHCTFFVPPAPSVLEKNPVPYSLPFKFLRWATQVLSNIGCSVRHARPSFHRPSLPPRLFILTISTVQTPFARFHVVPLIQRQSSQATWCLSLCKHRNESNGSSLLELRTCLYQTSSVKLPCSFGPLVHEMEAMTLAGSFSNWLVAQPTGSGCPVNESFPVSKPE